jgi:hypothetical protein
MCYKGDKFFNWYTKTHHNVLRRTSIFKTFTHVKRSVNGLTGVKTNCNWPACNYFNKTLLPLFNNANYN